MKRAYKNILWFIPFLLISCHKEQENNFAEEPINSKEYIENRSQKDFEGGLLHLDCLPHYSAISKYKKYCEKKSKDCALPACQKGPQGACTFDPKAFTDYFEPLCAEASGTHPEASLKKCQSKQKYGSLAACIGGYRSKQ